MRIAIAGAPASGKTRLAQELARQLPDCEISDEPALLRPLLTPAVLSPSGRSHAAQAYRQRYDLTLLTGLDLPAPQDRLTPDAATQQAHDAGLRAALQGAGIAFSVVYGLGEQRASNALRLITPVEHPAAPRAWVCEKCSDPDCELRLFTGLPGLKAAAHPRA